MGPLEARAAKLFECRYSETSKLSTSYLLVELYGSAKEESVDFDDKLSLDKDTHHYVEREYPGMEKRFVNPVEQTSVEIR